MTQQLPAFSQTGAQPGRIQSTVPVCNCWPGSSAPSRRGFAGARDLRIDPTQIEQADPEPVRTHDALPPARSARGTPVRRSQVDAPPDLLRHGRISSACEWSTMARPVAGSPRALFEPFFMTKDVGSTGLGLASVYGIVPEQRFHGRERTARAVLRCIFAVPPPLNQGRRRRGATGRPRRDRVAGGGRRLRAPDRQHVAPPATSEASGGRIACETFAQRNDIDSTDRRSCRDMNGPEKLARLWPAAGAEGIVHLGLRRYAGAARRTTPTSAS